MELIEPDKFIIPEPVATSMWEEAVRDAPRESCGMLGGSGLKVVRYVI